MEEHIDNIFCVLSEQGKVLFVTKSVERLLRYESSELIGRSWNELISEEDGIYITNAYRKSKEIKQNFTVRMLGKYREYVPIGCTLTKLHVEETSQIFYLALLKDNTSLKEAEEVLVRSEKMSVAGQLAAGIAHEIRNPLTSIKGFLQLLQAGVNRKEEYFKIMIDEIEKMEKITTELLFISKPLTDHKGREAISEMVYDIVSLLSPEAKLKNIDIIVDPSIHETIYCDKSQIKQVLINIVKNAIEAMDEAGQITIYIENTEYHTELCVCDEGPGVPEEIIHKLGEPFFTTKQNGTGLGIMITKRILEAHHGSLIIERNATKGSTFKLLFPK
ncbi:PAS domain-containing protein [Oceanobacillus piezotolerans]|uniref:histidine kinase n=2 Tax=Oceanobacillus piezotolerans TaxID=2448030 RepID=A0A498D788_9BACI|nr:PAS domain-containing protein [Oceanobacillus piezotolerans]